MNKMSYPLKSFFETIDKTISIAWGNNWGTFTKAYPSESESKSIKTPIITYRTSEKTPSQMGQVKEIKPRIRHQFSIPETGEAYQIWGQRFDCIVEFGVWADNDSKAEEYAEFFEEFMTTYCGLFKENGIIEIIHLKTVDEMHPHSWRVDFSSRHVIYHVIIDKKIPVSLATIEEVRVKLKNLKEDRSSEK